MWFLLVSVQSAQFQRDYVRDRIKVSAFTSPMDWLHATGPRPIYWLHVSKSAGTFFCNCGLEVGKRNVILRKTKNSIRNVILRKQLALPVKRTANDNINCHYMERDLPRWTHVDSPHADEFPSWAQGDFDRVGDEFSELWKSCAETARYMREQEIDFEGNENFLPWPLCVPNSATWCYFGTQ